jgi:hypothetical protein
VQSPAEHQAKHASVGKLEAWEAVAMLVEKSPVEDAGLLGDDPWNVAFGFGSVLLL